MAFNIADIFERAVDLMPEREAFVCGDARRTYAELDARANRVAHALADLGVQPGEHVGIYAPNCVEWFETMLGCFKLRAVPINVNFRYVEDELRYIFDNADLVAVVYDPQFADRLDAIVGELPKLRHRIAIGPELRGDAGGRRHPSATSASAPPTTSTSSTPAAPPACRRASCGARRTCSWRWARASTPSPATASSPTTSWRRRARRTRSRCGC